LKAGGILIIGTGIDIVEMKRIEDTLKRNARFIERVLTKDEQEIFHQLNSWKRKVEFVAGRFSAKEAYSKAIGTGIGIELSFQDIEIFTDDKGRPEIYVNGEKSKTAHISISHSEQFVVTHVIIEES
jgi:holo-[acyl-carrier protein] synthase